jgi:hypothetical protein
MLNASALRKLNASHSGFEEETNRVEGDNHLSGYLYKQSDHLKQWNLRYFCVMNSDHIKYYKKETDTSPKGFFSVAGCTFILANKKKLKGKELYTFEVSHPLSKNVLRLGSYTPEVVDMWVTTLRRIASGQGAVAEDGDTAYRLDRAMSAMNSVATYEEQQEQQKEMQEQEEEEDRQREEAQEAQETQEAQEAQETSKTPLNGHNHNNSTDSLDSLQSTTSSTRSSSRPSTPNVRQRRTSTNTPQNKATPPTTATTNSTKTMVSPSPTKPQPKSSPSASFLLPKENPLMYAGLSTLMAMYIILIPLCGQLIGRSVLPWYIGTDEATVTDRTADVLGNVCFLWGVTVSILIVVLQNRK